MEEQAQATPEKLDEKANQKALFDQLRKMLGGTCLTISIAPVLISGNKEDLLKSDPEAYYGLKAQMREVLLMMEKAIPDYKTALEKM